jgi:hypothetical protein
LRAGEAVSWGIYEGIQYFHYFPDADFHRHDDVDGLFTMLCKKEVTVPHRFMGQG